jgi:hypothetical protein
VCALKIAHARRTTFRARASRRASSSRASCATTSNRRSAERPRERRLDRIDAPAARPERARTPRHQKVRRLSRTGGYVTASAPVATA